MDELPALHDGHRPLELGDVGQRVSGQRDEIGESARREGADPVLPALSSAAQIVAERIAARGERP